MQSEEKYGELLKEIGVILSQKNDKLMMKEFETADLRKRLETAEQIIEELKKGNNHEQRN